MNLFNTLVQNTYQTVVNTTDRTNITDGTGSVITTLNITASRALTAISSSNASNAVSSSFASTASYVQSVVSASYVSGSRSVIGTLVNTTLTSSNVLASAINTQTARVTSGVDATGDTPSTFSCLTINTSVVPYTSPILLLGNVVSPNIDGLSSTVNDTYIAAFNNTSGMFQYADHLFIDGNNGFVGINNNAPSCVLDVVGNVKIAGGTSLSIEPDSSGNTNLNSTSGGITFTGMSTDGATPLNFVGSGANGDGNSIKFVSPDGNVRFEIGDGTNGKFSSGPADFGIDLPGVGNGGFYYDNNNIRVGIGNSIPQAALDVTGNDGTITNSQGDLTVLANGGSLILGQSILDSSLITFDTQLTGDISVICSNSNIIMNANTVHVQTDIVCDGNVKAAQYLNSVGSPFVPVNAVSASMAATASFLRLFDPGLGTFVTITCNNGILSVN